MRVAIIFTTWTPDKERSEMMFRSITSLIQTAPTAEILVADNGGNLQDSQWLLELTETKHLTTYTRFRNNMHFAYARNFFMKQTTADYIVICDNDIDFKEGWLEECLNFLENHPEKYLATPLAPDNMHIKGKYAVGELDGWKLNLRAGSNCFVISRASYEEIGLFPDHNLAGSKYVDQYLRLGYKMACMPVPKAWDLGFRKGYDFRNPTWSKDL